jgi:hypothetical protein
MSANWWLVPPVVPSTIRGSGFNPEDIGPLHDRPTEHLFDALWRQFRKTEKTMLDIPSPEDSADRLKRIATMRDLYVISERKNQAPCPNCGTHLPVYRYRLGKSLWWDLMRTYCACGYAQYPGHWFWKVLDRVSENISWVKYCWRKRCWVSRRLYLP